jgi:hypothetical protein
MLKKDIIGELTLYLTTRLDINDDAFWKGGNDHCNISHAITKPQMKIISEPLETELMM